MAGAASNTLLLAAIETALVFVAFSGIGEFFRTILGVTIGTGFAGLFRISGLGVVQVRKRNHRAKGEKQ